MPFVALTITLASLAAATASEPQNCLVASHAAGRIQSFSPQASDEKIQTFAEALPLINGMAEGPDGFLYLTTGAPNQSGSIVRIDPHTGIPTGVFWDGNTTAGTVAKRLTGIVFRGDLCYAAEADEGRIHVISADNGSWIGVAAESPGAVITQISVSKERLLAADFSGQKIIEFPSLGDGEFGAAEELHSTAPSAPWALLEAPDGRIFYSTNTDEIICLKNDSTEVWVDGEEARQVIYLGRSRDGKSLLLPSHATGWVSAWSMTEPQRQGWERQLPAAESVISMLEPLQSPDAAVPGATLKQDGSPGENPTAGILIKATAKTGRISHLGWDTEGGGREINNLLRAPMEFAIRQGGKEIPLLVEEMEVLESSIRGILSRSKGDKSGRFEIALQNKHLRLTANLNENGDGQILATLKLNPRMCSSSFHTSKWTSVDSGRLPGIFIAPDLGTMEVTSALPAEVRFTGDRKKRETTLVFSSSSGPKLALEFSPVTLANPTPGKNDDLWQKIRRGWWNLPIATSQWGPTDGTDGSIAGVWGNNVISNPVGSTLFWLADHILLQPDWTDGLSGADFLRYTVEYHLKNKVTPEGEVLYVNHNPGAMDANPSLVIAFWAVVEATGDLEWMKEWWPKLAPAIAYMNARDVDGDGLIESKQSGNPGTGAFGDTAWDTYSSGHKNAYVNALAHRAYKCLEALALTTGDAKSATEYGGRAAKLKAAFRHTFYNPETGWLAWWKSENGTLHDVHSDVPTSLATLCGLLDLADAKEMLDKYWTALQNSGFDNFALGVPLNSRPVPAAWQFSTWGGSNPDGSETFQKYLNGGCTVSNTFWFLAANQMVGNGDRANGILDKMVERQHKGVFPNGGGFQNGVVDIYPYGAEFYDWKGNTCGYEGHLVYSWTFLQAIPLQDPTLQERLYGFLGKSPAQ